MKLSLVMMAAAAVFAAPADDQQAALAPDSDGEMQALLSMDSFNITSADSEQNRMHAVCDMEYRLSKMAKMEAGRGLMTTSLSSTTSTAALFNPFTMPLMAVKQHISLLQQEEKFLQAQSDAFSGSSSATTTATPSDLTVSACKMIAAADTTLTAVTSRNPTDSLVMSFSTTKDIPAGQKLTLTLDLGEAAFSTAQKITIGSIDQTGTGAYGAALRACVTTDGSDANCKKPDGTAMTSAGITAAALNIEPANAACTLAAGACAATNSVASPNVKVGNGGIMVAYTLAEGLDTIKEGHWIVGVMSAFTTASKPITVHAALSAGTVTTGAVSGSGSATCPL